jgi:NAD(P)-dependent dehydrogenase (short-subunit alcohol dehydrogenase family)
MELQDQVIVVTGGARGIGRALCERFAREGARAVVVADVDRTAAEQTAQALGPVAQPRACDVAHEPDVQRLVAETLTAWGRIDLFCSNAGITAKGGCEVPNEDWDRLWRVNVLAHVFAARAVLPDMLARGSGCLLQTCSAAGLLTEVGSAAYSVVKHAAVAFAEWLSVRYRRRGIVVSCLCPAGVATEFLNVDDPVHQFLATSAVSVEQVADCVVEGLAAERFLILPHPQVLEFLQFKGTDYDRWLHNFSRIAEKLDSPRRRTPAEQAD